MTNEEQIEMMLAGEEKKVKNVALGEDFEEVEIVEAEPEKEIEIPWAEMTTKDKERWRRSVDERISHLIKSVDSIWTIVKDMSDNVNANHNNKVKKAIEKNKSDLEIPEGTQLHGATKNVNYFCMVKDGAFYVGTKRYESLSAAAQGVSGVRRSGWAFWRMPDGKTVKETYKQA